MQLNIFSIPPFIASLLTLLLGVFIYRKNRKSAQNIAYALECVSVFVWFLAYSVMFSCKDSKIASIFGKIGYVGVTFIPITFYHFTISLLGIKSQKNILKACYFLGAIFLLLLLATDLYISGVNNYYWGFYTKAGILHPLYLLFFMSLYNWSSILLFKHMRAEHNDIQRRNRIKFVSLAFFIPTFASVDFVPSYGFGIYPFGYLFIFAWLYITAYAIVRHQLMDIEVIIKKTIVFAGLLASVFAMLILPTLLIQEYVLRNAHFGGRLLGLAISGVIIILTMRRIETFLINITDKYLFQKKYDYRELLRTFTADVLTIVNLDKLVNLTVDKLI